MASTDALGSASMGPVAPVVDGILEQTQKEEKKTAQSMNQLGKDSFLQLLVCQMENQDPLNPTSDTEWISQLATYSSLEQMQNMSATMTNQQAFGLIGQEVIIKTTESNGDVKQINGVVDYVTIKNGQPYLNVGGKPYSMDDLISVVDYDYMVENCIPKVEASNATFDLADPKDVTFKVNMGTDLGAATAVAVILNEKVVDAAHVSLDKEGNVTLAAAALKDLEVGSYTPSIVFNDTFSTTSTGNFLLYVTDSSKSGGEGGSSGEGGTDGSGTEGGSTEKN